ncbi:hypothetical protein MF672_010710 [Actinomadura sp. ATCC 31491]|uniref:Uncharacterized protein n=1 Tax=Actinomadura luzonensis TaxID=2805427 RepID=A0ABT0FPH7_9ACTN|nr:hypothetical protein [Actinomadura luzonensis]MCK2214257.1 hypothetical protein [Actinomadura luzonensis]
MRSFLVVCLLVLVAARLLAAAERARLAHDQVLALLYAAPALAIVAMALHSVWWLSR